MRDGCGPRRGAPLAAGLLPGRAAGFRAGLLLALGLLAAPTTHAAESRCNPWPGEPDPLPTVASRDPAQARWAELRLAELVARAQLAEANDPVESQRLWRRALCVDPANQPAWLGLGRTRVVSVYRPEWRWGGSREAAPGDPWQGLDARVSVVRPRPPAPVAARTPPAPQPPAPTPKQAAPATLQASQRAALDAAGKELAAGEVSLREARFEEALSQARAGSQALAGAPPHAEVDRLRSRAGVLAATAQVALGDEAGARQSFNRALAANPTLRLDPMKTSPKVIQALEAARNEAGP